MSVEGHRHPFNLDLFTIQILKVLKEGLTRWSRDAVFEQLLEGRHRWVVRMIGDMEEDAGFAVRLGSQFLLSSSVH